MITIRTARPVDIPELVELLTALFAIEADFNIDQAKQASGLNQLLESEANCVLVAVRSKDEKVLGMCTVQTLISTAEGGRVGMLEDLVVAAEFRNQGIASKLLDEAVVWAECQGLKRLQLLADKNNQTALDFYAKKAWQSTRLICLRKR
jgi:ribosomal protein S18 acetylase RimI-like enzyme